MITEAGTPAPDEDPTKAECDHALSRMYEFLDREIDTASGDQIRQHLSECEPCLDQFDVEQAIKALVHRHCGNDLAPSHLRMRIVTQLEVVRKQF